jgi:putative hydroxymethylpyrimidine transport system substrate-binding protein
MLGGRRTAGDLMALAIVVSVAAAACSSGGGAGTLTKVRMVQEWPVADAFWIPWIVAKEKGYYKDVGIDLEIITPPTAADTVKFLATDKADLAFTTILDVIFGKGEGTPIVSIGAYSQSNNWGLIAREGEDFAIADLKGKNIGIYNDAWTLAQLSIMLKSAGLTVDDVKTVADPSDTIPLLIAKKVDVATGVTNAEASEMRTVGAQTPFMLMAKDYGVPDSPIWVIGASTTFLEKAENKELTKKWFQATEKGLADAIANPQAAVDSFLKAYPGAADPAYALDQWTTTIPLFESPGGHFSQNDGQWQPLLDLLVSEKIIDSALPPADYYTTEYVSR